MELTKEQEQIAYQAFCGAPGWMNGVKAACEAVLASPGDEAQLDALQWTPITAENMPKQGDELLGRCGNGVYYVNEYGGLADYARLVAEEEWTHFRPINAPQSGGSR